MDEDFLLSNESSKVLYYDYAKDMPIFDFHCHLNPQEIAENKQFKNMTEIWLNGDHYKWRALRSHGIDEQCITGDAGDKDKFRAWAKTVPYCIGNPLYHWTHLELKRYFNVEKLLNEETCDDIWEHCNEKLQQGDMTAQSIIKKSNVKAIFTTDDPTDHLEYHKAIQQNENVEAKVLPTFRPDKALEINKPSFTGFIDDLSEAGGRQIDTYQYFLQLMEKRIHYFHQVGCRISDHSIEYLPFEECTFEEAAAIFLKRKDGQAVSCIEENKYKTFTLLFLGRTYSSLGWAMQLHLGALRNNNTRMFNLIGGDSGFDSMRDFELAKPLNQLLNSLDRENQLPKTIIYNLNPVHNDVVASMIGNFQTGGIKGKVQFGSGWWFNDQKDGMIKQMSALANIGLISNFVGMLTDSRSFLSYTRHEYFRRILCDLFGRWIDQGEAPKDYSFIGNLVQDISYNNANHYFDI